MSTTDTNTISLVIVTAGTHQPSDLVSGQATPTIDDTYGSLVSASPELRSRFRTDVRLSS
jgi:hypothetical protein